ncbi:MAG: prolyl oligopeptidase family serine peptidase [Candidatus Poribacteria bacterium]
MKAIFPVIALFICQSIYAAVETGSYTGTDSIKLRFLIGIPNQPSQKVFIYIQGDGQGCTPFPLAQARQAMEYYSHVSSGYWIFPETAKEALCESGLYKTLDFYHRVTELKNLVATIRNDPPFSNSQIYLVGHSAGTDLSARAAVIINNVSGIVLISGGELPLETMIYQKTLIDGYRANRTEADIQKDIREVQELAKTVKANCSMDQHDWGDRCNLFWCQMFTSTLEQDALNASNTMKVLLVHGLKDDIVPVEGTFSLYSKLISKKAKVRLKIYQDMDHNFAPKIHDLISIINEWSKS